MSWVFPAFPSQQTLAQAAVVFITNQHRSSIGIFLWMSPTLLIVAKSWQMYIYTLCTTQHLQNPFFGTSRFAKMPYEYLHLVYKHLAYIRTSIGCLWRVPQRKVCYSTNLCDLQNHIREESSCVCVSLSWEQQCVECVCVWGVLKVVGLYWVSVMCWVCVAGSCNSNKASPRANIQLRPSIYERFRCDY